MAAWREERTVSGTFLPDFRTAAIGHLFDNYRKAFLYRTVTQIF
jgi:hypothetical protein